MAFTHFSKHLANPGSKAVLVAGLVSAQLIASTPAKASVLVDPMIRRGGGTAQPEAPASAPVMPAATSSATQNIVDLAGSTRSFSTLTSALQAANLLGILSEDGPFTVFAPTNEAFSALPAGTLETLLKPENSDLLVKLLYNHVAYGDVTSNQLSPGPLDTFDSEVAVAVTPSGITVDSANVVQADVDATNGVIHAVDKVLIPSGFDSQLQARISGGTPDAASESSSTTAAPQATTLQETAIDRSVAPTTPTPAAPEATATPAESVPASTPEPAAVEEEPVRGLW